MDSPSPPVDYSWDLTELFLPENSVLILLCHTYILFQMIAHKVIEKENKAWVSWIRTQCSFRLWNGRSPTEKKWIVSTDFEEEIVNFTRSADVKTRTTKLFWSRDITCSIKAIFVRLKVTLHCSKCPQAIMHIGTFSLLDTSMNPIFINICSEQIS